MLLKTGVALSASDPRAVAMYVDIDGDDWANIYPPEKKKQRMSTGNAIDKFIATYGKSTPEEDRLLERLILNPVPDYSSVLEKQEKQEKQENLEEVKKQENQEIQKIQPASQPPQPDDTVSLPAETPASVSVTPIPVPTAPVPNVFKAESSRKSESNDPTSGADNSAGPQLLTLELAKIFVKQGQFQRAKDIISKIILNNPEKSAYFADQLRFLDKLIYISGQKND